ncbi:phosphatidylglycerophosphatase A family protein [Flectobacillus major]|jgi:phosphatidylglycerophosphatase A|uniref:phosphatidylglycerophosphatase A family protein n=1 Tax=Flectobacillus major TaxID=103 RepID=UPI00040D98E5|nr:phosphatidylglycerophosphatase A [Flectobacillus major]
MKYTKFHIAVASALGLGYIPKGSGTFGAILACFVVLVLDTYLGYSSIWYQGCLLLLTAVFMFLGRWSSMITEKIWGEDSSKIVIDEVVGQWLTLCFIPFSWQNLLLGLLFFRIYDIFKPFNIRKFENYENGWGVMLDDVAAGVWANLTLQVILLII